ncbi:hypothetical protein [Parvicella tangerina]|uniref:Uncharacterized protein n=1 Tax=Parvicella tangerina TaxID=2829795 RepID=A0A916JQA0_9FLAO|nr:hypothetical protein [Parvicella tangerina]CAG5086798.1 hypothetical protein CRYO30217_03284 [Parvicella tangerina]
MKIIITYLLCAIVIGAIGQQDISIEYKDTTIYRIQNLGEGLFHVLYFNDFEEIEFSRGVNRNTKLTQEGIWLNNEVNWLITFYNDSLIEIRHHMTDSIDSYCSPCKNIKRD